MEIYKLKHTGPQIDESIELVQEIKEELKGGSPIKKGAENYTIEQIIDPEDTYQLAGSETAYKHFEPKATAAGAAAMGRGSVASGLFAQAEGGLRTGFEKATLYVEEDLAEEDKITGFTYEVLNRPLSDSEDLIALNKGETPNYYFKENGVNLTSASNNPLSKSNDTPSGIFTEAKGNQSHAEGSSTLAAGAYSHSEGTYTRAYGQATHAEGYFTKAVGTGSHAEGNRTLALGGYSHAEGGYTEALWQESHAEGSGSKAGSQGAHAEGMYTQALGMGSHTEGGYTKVPSTAQHAHAEGFLTEVGDKAHYQHVQGKANIPMGPEYVHVVGWGTTQKNPETQLNEVVEGKNIYTLKTDGEAWFAKDVYTGADRIKLVNANDLSTALSQLNVNSSYFKKGGVANSTVHSVSGWVGATTIKLKNVEKIADDPVKYALYIPITYFTIGENDTLTPNPLTDNLFKNTQVIIKDVMYTPHTLLGGATTFSDYEIVGDTVKLIYNNYYGFETVNYTFDETKSYLVLNYQVSNTGSLQSTSENPISSLGTYAFSQGLKDAAINNYTHAEGTSTIASGSASHAEGSASVSSGQNAHAEGSTTLASGSASHAEGYKTHANGYCAHAEGLSTIALGSQAHAEGHTTKANGAYAHAEGYLTEANGNGSHAGGWGSKATKPGSFAHGNYATANADYQTVFGKYNVIDNNKKYAHIIGWGDATTPKNIFALDTLGNAEFAGTVTANGATLISDADARTIAVEETAKIVAGADASYDTLKEISDWITNDTTGAAQMANDSAELKTRLPDPSNQAEGAFLRIVNGAWAAVTIPQAEGVEF